MSGNGRPTALISPLEPKAAWTACSVGEQRDDCGITDAASTGATHPTAVCGFNSKAGNAKVHYRVHLVSIVVHSSIRFSEYRVPLPSSGNQ